MLADSGDRTNVAGTGALRDMAEGKGRCDLLPACAVLRLARHYEAGAKKYSDRNWEKGLPISNFMDSGMRHMLKYMDGMDDEDHLAAAAWNILGAMWTEEKKPELQDIPTRLSLFIPVGDENSEPEEWASVDIDYDGPEFAWIERICNKNAGAPFHATVNDLIYVFSSGYSSKADIEAALWKAKELGLAALSETPKYWDILPNRGIIPVKDEEIVEVTDPITGESLGYLPGDLVGEQRVSDFDESSGTLTTVGTVTCDPIGYLPGEP